MTNCYSCKTPLSENQYGRQESCPQCGRDTRVCRNCVHYESTHHNSCRESQADRVVEKERSNFCDYFSPTHHTGSSILSKDSFKLAAEALFKKK